MSTEQIPEANDMLGLFTLKNLGEQENREIASLNWTRHEQVPDVSNTTQYNPEILDRQNFRYMPYTMLEVQFKVDKTTGGATVETSDYTGLASDGWSLFSQCSLSLNGQQIRPNTITRPAVLSTLRRITEDDEKYVDSVGQISHQYVDHVDQFGTTGMTVVTPHTAVQTALSPASALAGIGHYHEISTSKYVTTATAGEYFLASATMNPDFDKSFKAKVDRSTGVQTILLPLSQVFNVLDAMSIVQGVTVKLDLVKNSRTSALFGALSTADFTIQKVALWSCDVVPTVEGRVKFNKALKESNMTEKLLFENYQSFLRNMASYAEAGEKSVQIGASINRPLRAIVAFQKTARAQSVNINPLLFDLPTDMTSCAMFVDGKQVPSRSYNLPTDKFRVLSDMYRINSKLPEYSESSITQHDRWVDAHYPVIVFDLAQHEATSFESKSQSNLELRYTQSSASGVSYDVHIVLVSHADMLMSFADGVTTFRTS